MFTSILLLAISGAPTAGEAPAWQSYAEARKLAETDSKPLAVIVSPGQNGWKKLAQGGSPSGEATQSLASKYICVHVDSSTPEGKQLANAFAFPSGLGIVISDRTGTLQAFRHEGDLTNQKLVTYLNKYGSPDWKVSTTESNPGNEDATCVSGTCTTGTCVTGTCTTGTCTTGTCTTGTCTTGTCNTGGCYSGGCYGGGCYSGGCHGGRCHGGRCR